MAAPSPAPHHHDESGRSDRSPARPPELGPLHTNDPLGIGPYRIAGRLGAGGMGAVYGAVDDQDRCVAVKAIHRTYAGDAEFRKRFAREVALVRGVHGPGLAAFCDADPSADIPWLATAFVPGPTLHRHVTQHGPLSGSMLPAFAAATAEALVAVHAAGVVHRDLKPGNVILAPTGPVVLDFGIARAVEGTALTRTGGVVGTAGWVSPEQYRGEEVTDRADLFTWGALTAYAAHGNPPFGESGSDVVAGRILSGEADLEGLPAALRVVVSAALDKDPASRPSAREAAQAVSAVADPAARGEVSRLLASGWTAPESGHRPQEWPRHAPPRRSWPRRHPVRATVAAGLAGALVAAVAWWAADAPAPLPGGADQAADAAEGTEPPATAARVTEGQEVPEDYQPYIESGYVEVRTEPVSRATLVGQLNAPDYLGPDAEALDRLEAHLLAARADGDGVEVVVGLEYLLDFAGLVVSAEDFLVGTHWFAHGEGEQTRMDTQAAASASEVELSADDPLAELTLAFDEAPAEGVVIYHPPEVVDERYNDPGLAPEATTGYCYDVNSQGGHFPESPGFTEHDPESSCLPDP